MDLRIDIKNERMTVGEFIELLIGNVRAVALSGSYDTSPQERVLHMGIYGRMLEEVVDEIVRAIERRNNSADGGES